MPSLKVRSMKPAFSPILMKAILTSALTCSLYSETLHFLGLGSKPGSVGGVFGSVGSPPPAQPPSIPTAVATLQMASWTTLPNDGALLRALADVPPTRIATKANAAAYSSVAAPRWPERARRCSRANMADVLHFSTGVHLRLSGAGTKGHGPAGPTEGLSERKRRHAQGAWAA